LVQVGGPKIENMAKKDSFQKTTPFLGQKQTIVRLKAKNDDRKTQI
jgi:hypothetical protein